MTPRPFRKPTDPPSPLFLSAATVTLGAWAVFLVLVIARLVVAVL